MQVDKSSFVLALATLTAGGVGGFAVADRNLLKLRAPTSASLEGPAGVPDLQHASDASAASAEPSSPAAPPAPSCDDMAGAPGACPSPGYPAEEGGCGGWATKRCEDFKQAMKPRVAERAVACLNALNPMQRCDPSRVNLCAHAALMSACPEVDAPVGKQAALSDEVGVSCEAILRGCGSASIAPTMRDCRATLAGLSIFGKDQIASCMRTHCADKGLLGCEGATETK